MKDMSLARRVAEAALTPLVPADVLDLVAPLRAGADLRGRIVAVEPETADAATLLIRPGKDWVGHVPGQYVRIGIDVDGVRQWRAYSLTHGPRADRLISITVKAVPDGLVSNHLVHRARPGTLVHLEQAAGEFVVPEAGGKLLFVTAGSGITPVIGMLRNLFPATDDGRPPPTPQRRPRHRRRARRPQRARLDLPRRPQVAAQGGRHLARRAVRRRGRPARRRRPRDRFVPDLAARTTFACGPAGLLDALQAHHDERGLELQIEQFRSAPFVAGEGGTVSFARTGTTLEADGSTPILDAAEEAGVLMPSGCRMGICYQCVLPLREGAVRDLRTGELTTVAPGGSAQEWVKVQTCINAAAGPCHLDH